MSTELLGTDRLERSPLRLTWAAALDVRLHLALAMLTGFFLRFWHLSSVPPGLNQDEAVYGYDAYSIFMTGRDHLGHPFPFASLETFGDWSSPLLTYLSIPFVALFGLNVEALRGTSALVGVAAIPAVFCLALLLFKRTGIALVAMWALAVTPWAVHLSRWAIIPTAVPTMIALTLVVLVWAMQTRNERGIVFAALLAALTIAAYHAMKVYVPLVCIAAVAVYWRDIRHARLEPLIYAGVVFLAIAGPILYLTVRDPGGGARLSQTSILNDHSLTPGLLVAQYASYFSPRFWFVSGDGDPMHLPSGQGLEPLTLAPFLVAGLVWLGWTALNGSDLQLRRSAALMLLLVVLFPVPGMMTLPNPHVLRSVHAIPIAALVLACGVIGIVDLVQLSFRPKRQWVAVRVAAFLSVCLVATLGMELTSRYINYFGRYPDQVAENFRYGMKDVLAYVDANKASYDEVWVDDNNSSYIYVLFYRRWRPSEVHRDLVVRRNPPDWNHVDSIGKYRFGEASPVEDRRLMFSSHGRNCEAGYNVVSATLAERRVLLIEPSHQCIGTTPRNPN